MIDMHSTETHKDINKACINATHKRMRDGAPVLLGEELEQIACDLFAIKLEGVVAALTKKGVVSVQGPVPTVDSFFAVCDRLGKRPALPMVCMYVRVYVCVCIYIYI
jgi:hypothetical protein